MFFGSRRFDPAQPVLVDLGYETGGHQIGFTGLEAEPLGDGSWWFRYGIPQYGDYTVTTVDVSQPGIDVPQEWDQAIEYRRSMGSAAYGVTEEAGVLHGSITEDRLRGAADLEAVRGRLTDEGWVLEPPTR